MEQNKKSIVIVGSMVLVGILLWSVFFYVSRKEKHLPENVPDANISVNSSPAGYVVGQVYDSGQGKYVFKKTTQMNYGVKLDIFYKQSDDPENEIGLIHGENKFTVGDDLASENPEIQKLNSLNDITMEVVQGVRPGTGQLDLKVSNLAGKTLFDFVKMYNSKGQEPNDYGGFYAYLPFVNTNEFSTAGWSLFEFGMYGGLVYPPTWVTTAVNVPTNVIYDYKKNCKFTSSYEDAEVTGCEIDFSKIPFTKIMPKNSQIPSDYIGVAQFEDDMQAQITDVDSICNTLQFIPASEKPTKHFCRYDRGYYLVYTSSNNPEVLAVYNKAFEAFK